MGKYVFGVDVGGTYTKFGIFKDRKLIDKWKIDTDVENCGENILKNIGREIDKKTESMGVLKSSVEGCGICVPGPVDEKGLVRGCVNLGWGYKRAAVEIENITGLKCAVLNDANAAALGEFDFGLGGEYDSAVMVTIGTGVGGAVIYKGQVLSGYRGNAGEIGHFKIDPLNGPECSCGKKGCLECYSSATGIVRFAYENLEKYPDTKLCIIENFTVKDMADLASEGDELCKLAFDRAGKFVALGLSFMAGAVDPKVFIIGGGVSQAGDVIFEPIRKYFKQFAFNTEEETPVLPAKLGNDAGIFGAAEFILKRRI